MPKEKLLETIGFVLIIFGFLLTLAKGFMGEESVLMPLLEKRELLYTLGMLLWALGYLLRQNKEKQAGK